MNNSTAAKAKRMAVSRFSNEFDRLERNRNSGYNERVYMNLPVTKLERVFFRLLAKRMKMNSTKLVRFVIGKLMDKYPSIVSEAADIINEESD